MIFYITGKVLPERAGVLIPKIEREVEGLGSVTFVCYASQITITVGDTPNHQYAVFLHAKQFASIIVSSLGFALGCGYSVELINITDNNRNSEVRGVNIEELREEDYVHVFNQVVNLSFSDIYLRFAILDYVKAITDEFECPFLCYRAIETIHSRFRFENRVDDHKAWEIMHKELGTNREEIETQVKHYADPIRHGKYFDFRSTTLEVRVNILKLTKRIILLYRDYLNDHS